MRPPSRSRRLAVTVGAALAGIFFAGVFFTGVLLAEQAPVALTAGAVHERALAAGQVHVYHLSLAAGELARLTVEQRGLDVALRILDPAGEELLVMDSPNGAWGPERASIVAERSGDHRLEVVAPSASGGAGRYRLEIEALRPASADDRAWAAAEALEAQAAALAARRERAQLLEAAALYRRALDAWSQLGEARREAGTLFDLATVRRALGDGDAALALLDQALALQQRAADRAGEARSLNALGLVHRGGGRSTTARERFTAALDLFAELGDRAGEAGARNNLGLLEHAEGRLQQALEHYRSALELFEVLGDRRVSARVLNNLGGVHDLLGEWPEAAARYRQALEIYRAVEQRRGEAGTLSNLAVVERHRGRWQEALDLYRQALEIATALGDARGEAALELHRASLYADLGEAETCLAAVERAAERLEGLDDPRLRSQAHHFRGRCAAMLGRRAEALASYRRALELRRELGDRVDEAETLRRIGELELEAGQPAAASGSFRRGLELAWQVGHPRLEAIFRHRLAAAHRAAGEAAAALEQDRAALEIALEIGDPMAELEVRRGLALDEKHHRRPEAALHQVAAALDRFEALRGELLDPQHRAAFQAVGRGLHELDVELLAALDRLRPEGGFAARAFRAAERSRARTLLERILEVEGRPLPRPEPIALGEVAPRLLAEGDLLLSYFLGGERSHLWAISLGGHRVFELPERERIEAAARALHRHWRRLDPAAGAEERRAAEKLAELVLPPALPIRGARRLLVVPDGALHSVPFAALPFAARADATSAGGPAPPLVVGHEVMVLPSVSMLAALRAQSRRAGGEEVAVFADPLFAEGDLPPLPSSRREAAAIAELAAGRATLELGAEASLEALRALPFGRLGILHLATHARIDERQPGRSGVVLSQLDAESRPREAWLYLDEIYRLELGGTLVVLSACRTAAGRTAVGEGPLGLGRGFLAAGARAVVATLWQVDDRAGAELMASFYRGHLASSLSPAGALRQAQLELRGRPRYRHPFYWAPYVVYGDGTAAPRAR